MHLVGLEILDMPRDKGVELMGVSSAVQQYRRFFGNSEPDPLSLVMRIPSIWSIQHDTGRLSFIVEEPRSGRIELVGYGYPTRVMCGQLKAYQKKFFELAGWGEVTIEELTCELDGADRCSWGLGWTNPLPDLVFRKLMDLKHTR